MKTEFKGETILRAFGLTVLGVIKTAFWVIRKKIERRGRGKGGREKKRKREGGKEGEEEGGGKEEGGM